MATITPPESASTAGGSESNSFQHASLLSAAGLLSAGSGLPSLTGDASKLRAVLRFFCHKQQVVCGRGVVVLSQPEALLGVVAGHGQLHELLHHFFVELDLGSHLDVLVLGGEAQRRVGDLVTPRVVLHLRQREPLLWVRDQHVRHQVREGTRDVVWEFIPRRQDLVVEHRLVLILKGQEATDKGKQDHTAAPDVAALGRVALARDHLGRRVAGRAASRLQALTAPEGVAETEIHDLDVSTVV
mmetsp:Transcript_181461/g.576028  ORF Transcript_181461/g.576028 Transcript_181461/m.576028 type:complete len:243 (+) Transcript_181461:1577-2305(+)